MELVPLTFRQACEFVDGHHRHHARPAGHKWSVGAVVDGVLRGVAIVGRPSARAFDDGRTLEVVRTCTDGYPNVNSALYGAVARAGFAMGYARVVTYTQAGESGASLRGAGWRVVAVRPARSGWWCPSRPRRDRGDAGVARTLWEAC